MASGKLFPDVLVALARLRAKTCPASIRLAMWALETNWGKSTLFQDYNNLAGIKRSSKIENRTYQSGEVNLGGFVYATYRDWSMAMQDWDAKLEMHRTWSPNLTILQRLDRHWSPLSDQKDHVSYSIKIQQIITKHNLTAFDRPGEGVPVAIDSARMVLIMSLARKAWTFIVWVFEVIHEVEESGGNGEQKKARVKAKIQEAMGAWLADQNIFVRKAVAYLIDAGLDWLVTLLNSALGKTWIE